MRSCWSCGWNQIGTLTLLGTCWGWLAEKGGPMEITAAKGESGYKADLGCRRWRADKADFAALKKPAVKITEEEI